MLLEIQHLGFSYTRGAEILSDINFALQDGETLSILGANGAGKTTLLNCVAGLFVPNTGQVLLDGESVHAMKKKDLAKLIGYVPQIHGGQFAYSVLEYAVMGRAPYIPAYGKPSEEDYETARANLRKVGLGHKIEKIYTEMSGGEQQLASIARVLTQAPKIIMLDEPTNHLDYGNQYRVLDVMKQLSEEGFGIISTTHHPDHAFMLGGKAAVVNKGSFTLGPVDDVLTSESLSALYRMNIHITSLDGQKVCVVKGGEGF